MILAAIPTALKVALLIFYMFGVVGFWYPFMKIVREDEPRASKEAIAFGGAFLALIWPLTLVVIIGFGLFKFLGRFV